MLDIPRTGRFNLGSTVMAVNRRDARMPNHDLASDVANPPENQRTFSLDGRLTLNWCTQGDRQAGWFHASDAPVTVIAADPIEHAEPAVLATVAAWGAERARRGLAVEIDDSAKSVYAWRSGLLSALRGGQAPHVPNRRVLPITHVRSEHDIAQVALRLRELLGLDDPTGQAVAYCVAEVLRNVFEHSSSRVGAWIAAGHFDRTGRITVAVADAGEGIPDHIRRAHRAAIDDVAATTTAVQPYVTGSSDRNRNAGLGLHMTRRLAVMTGGGFWVYSGNAVLRDDPVKASDDRHQTQLDARAAQARAPGTTVVLTMYPQGERSLAEALDTARREASGGKAGSKRGFGRFRKAPPPGARVVRVEPDMSTIAQDKDRARIIRTDEILPALAAEQDVWIDLTDVALATQSFMHALLAEPLRKYGAKGLERCSFGCRHQQVKETVRMVVGYVLDDL